MVESGAAPICVVWVRTMQPGAVIRGKYRIERTLGSGGMGTVFLALHLRMGQFVALKTLHSTALTKPGMVERFAREAKAAATLRSAHAVRVLDVDESEEKVPFFVMEYLDGQDVESALRDRSFFDATKAIQIILEACVALAEAHAVGIVHRDIKPANLFLANRVGSSPLVKILDFGISKTTSEDETALGLTATQAVLGSPLYMSPEQLRASRDVDGRTDVWSLGVVLHQLLTGKLPFTGTTATAITASIAADKPASLRSTRPDLPEELESVLDRCLAKKPDERYQSVLDFARALAPFGGEPGLLEEVEGASRTTTAVSPSQRETKVALVSGRKTQTLSPSEIAIRQTPSFVEGSSTEAAAAATRSVRPTLARQAPRNQFYFAAALLLAVTGAGLWLVRPNTKGAASPSNHVAEQVPSAIVPSPSLSNVANVNAAASDAVNTPVIEPDASAPVKPTKKKVPTRPVSAESTPTTPTTAPAKAPRNPLEVDIK